MRAGRSAKEFMSVAIHCILEEQLPDLPLIEGKSLAIACCAEAGRDEGEATEGDVIAIAFPGKREPNQVPAESREDTLITPLLKFVHGQQGLEWHNPSDGLKAVRTALTRLRDGETIQIDPEMESFGSEDPDELAEGVVYDLEILEEVLTAAQEAKTRFYLAFDI
jgi:hypothetical protein